MSAAKCGCTFFESFQEGPATAVLCAEHWAAFDEEMAKDPRIVQALTSLAKRFIDPLVVRPEDAATPPPSEQLTRQETDHG